MVICEYIYSIYNSSQVKVKVNTKIVIVHTSTCAVTDTAH